PGTSSRRWRRKRNDYTNSSSAFQRCCRALCRPSAPKWWLRPFLPGIATKDKYPAIATCKPHLDTQTGSIHGTNKASLKTRWLNDYHTAGYYSPAWRPPAALNSRAAYQTAGQAHKLFAYRTRSIHSVLHILSNRLLLFSQAV